MDARFYNSEEIDIERLANDLVNIYLAQGYQAQQIGNKDQMLVQLKKGGDFEALIGMQTALSLTIQRTSGGTLAMIGQQRWIDKAAVGAVGIVAFPVLWPLALTAGVGAVRQASLANAVLNVVDGLVRQQQPEARVGPIPVQVMPQVQQQWAPPPYSSSPQQIIVSQPAPVYTPPPAPVYMPPPAPAPAPPPARSKLRCPSCNTPYEAGDTFCSGCGRSLVPPKTYCPNCKTEIKPDVAFCPKCGASTFQASTASTPAQAAPAPKPAPTPPPAPTVQAYTPPAPQQASPPPVPAKPVPQGPYVPPVPQEPPVMPKPTITMIPGTPKQETPPAASKQPPTPIVARPAGGTPPPVQPQLVKPRQKASPPPPKPIASKPASQPAFDPNAAWGHLVFSDGKQVQLSGERAVVGRYDHDLGGLNPEVDLGSMQGADAVSRIHAMIEHIGSAYTVTDLNSTNATKLNGKRLEPDKAIPINDGDTLQFGKITCTFKKA